MSFLGNDRGGASLGAAGGGAGPVAEHPSALPKSARNKDVVSQYIAKFSQSATCIIMLKHGNDECGVVFCGPRCFLRPPHSVYAFVQLDVLITSSLGASRFQCRA